MSKQISEYIAKLEANIALLRAFAERYDIPDGLGYAYASADEASFSVHLQFESQPNRDKALLFMGETFGRHEWMASTNHSRNGFDWRKTVDGVRLTIYDAEHLPRPESFPVPPQKFPLQLTDASDVQTPN